MQYELILYAIAFILLIYKIISIEDIKEISLFILFFTIVFLIANYELIDPLNLLSGYIIFNALISSYGTKKLEFFTLAALLFIFINYFNGLLLITTSIFFGGISSYNIYPRKKHNIKKTTYQKELRRNTFTILSGFILLALVLFLQLNIFLVVSVIFLVGILLLNTSLISKNNIVSRFFQILERDNFTLGHGAIWLGLGTCFAVSFLSYNVALSAICFIFIADCVSPIIGMKYGGIKLFYNKRKSYAGTASYFLTGLILSYILIGNYAFLIAAIAAIVESLPFSLDDNFDVPFAIFILSTLIPL
ncbi:MAG: hypothetical protein ACP5M9_03835 [Candidatus Micrarchaeia archaeon]